MRFRPPDAIALVAVPLVVAAFRAEGAVLPTICLCLASAIVIFAIAGHDELSWQRRVAIGAFASVVDVRVDALVPLPMDSTPEIQAADIIAYAKNPRTRNEWLRALVQRKIQPRHRNFSSLDLMKCSQEIIAMARERDA